MAMKGYSAFSKAPANDFKYCYVTLTIQFNVSFLFVHSWIVKQFYLTNWWNPKMFYLPRSEWTWELLRWRGSAHSIKLQNWSLTIRSGLVSYPGHWLEVSYTSAEMQSAYSTALVDYPCSRCGVNWLQISGCLFLYLFFYSWVYFYFSTGCMIRAYLRSDVFYWFCNKPLFKQHPVNVTLLTRNVCSLDFLPEFLNLFVLPVNGFEIHL